MPRARDPNRNKAFQIYMDAGGKIDLVEIASQLNISAGTVRGMEVKGQMGRTVERNAPNKSYGTLQTV